MAILWKKFHVYSFVYLLIFLLMSCSKGQIDYEGCLPGKPFVLGPDGGSFTVEQWTFSVLPNQLTKPVVFTAKQCPEKDFNHKMTHHFVGTESGDTISVEAMHPVDPRYPTLKIETDIPVSSNIISACQNALPGDDAKQLLVTNHNNALIPVFGKEPTKEIKCYNVDFSLAANTDGGNGNDQTYESWFSTLQSAFNQVKIYTNETLSQYMAAVEQFANEKYEKYVSTCFACKQAANFLINKISCSGLLISDLKKAGCISAISAFTSGTGILFSGVVCSGLGWAFDELQKKLTGTTLTDLCDQLLGNDTIVNNLKSEICSLCNTYMPAFNCTTENDSKKTCPQLACKDILSKDSCEIDPQGCAWENGSCKAK